MCFVLLSCVPKMASTVNVMLCLFYHTLKQTKAPGRGFGYIPWTEPLNHPDSVLREDLDPWSTKRGPWNSSNIIQGLVRNAGSRAPAALLPQQVATSASGLHETPGPFGCLSSKPPAQTTQEGLGIGSVTRMVKTKQIKKTDFWLDAEFVLAGSQY